MNLADIARVTGTLLSQSTLLDGTGREEISVRCCLQEIVLK